MSQTVGITTAIGTRLILEGKITRRGVLSPIYKDIYMPIMKELERFGIRMIEESERADLMYGPKAKL
jgi:saccharopine dehydrogenase (NADP+, L-glutamate forming)